MNKIKLTILLICAYSTVFAQLELECNLEVICNSSAVSWMDLTGTAPNVSTFPNDQGYISGFENLATDNLIQDNEFRTYSFQNALFFSGTTGFADYSMLTQGQINLNSGEFFNIDSESKLNIRPNGSNSGTTGQVLKNIDGAVGETDWGNVSFTELSEFSTPTASGQVWGWDGSNYAWLTPTGGGSNDGVISGHTVTGTNTKTSTITRTVGADIIETWTDLTLNESQVDAFVANNGYLTTEVDGSITNEIELPTGGINGQILSTDGAGNYSWVNDQAGSGTDGVIIGFNVTGTTTKNFLISRSNGLSNITGSWIDLDTKLSESEVDAFVANNGYLTDNIYTANGTLPDERTATVTEDFNLVGSTNTADVWFNNLHVQGIGVNEAAFMNDPAFMTYSTTTSGVDYVGYRGSTSALANDNITIVGGENELYLKTPNTYAGTTTVGQVPRLQNSTGLIEYEDFSFNNLDGLPTINVTSTDGTVNGVLNLSTSTLQLQATTGGVGGGGNVADMITNVTTSGNDLVFTGQNGAFSGNVSLSSLSVNWNQLTGIVPNVSIFPNDAGYITTESQNLFRDVSVSSTWIGGVIQQNGTLTASNPTDEVIFAPKDANTSVELVGNQILIGANEKHFANTNLTATGNRVHDFDTNSLIIENATGFNFDMVDIPTNGDSEITMNASNVVIQHNQRVNNITSVMNLSNGSNVSLSIQDNTTSEKSSFTAFVNNLQMSLGIGQELDLNRRPDGFINVSIGGIKDDYTSESAANADVNLLSGSVYQITGSDQLYRKK